MESRPIYLSLSAPETRSANGRRCTRIIKPFLRAEPPNFVFLLPTLAVAGHVLSKIKQLITLANESETESCFLLTLLKKTHCFLPYLRYSRISFRGCVKAYILHNYCDLICAAFRDMQRAACRLQPATSDLQHV